MARDVLNSATGKAHMAVIANAPEGERAKLASIAADCCVNQHENTGDVSAYLDAEYFYSIAIGSQEPTVSEIEAYLNAVEGV